MFSKDLQDLADALENLSQPIFKGRYPGGPRPKFDLDGASGPGRASLQPPPAALEADAGRAGAST